MSLLEIMQKRRSVRKYTGEAISEENLTAVLQAGLLSASGKGKRPWELIVVRDKDTLKKMSDCRAVSVKMLEEADAAIAVIANTDLTDVWIEDCSVVMANMHLMADSLGLGSCWVQGRLREAADGQTTGAYLRGVLGYPENFELVAVLALGMPQEHPDMQKLEDLPMDKVHWGKF